MTAFEVLYTGFCKMLFTLMYIGRISVDAEVLLTPHSLTHSLMGVIVNSTVFYVVEPFNSESARRFRGTYGPI
jgi:hypothetical protein